MFYVLFVILTIFVGYKLELFDKKNEIDDLTTYDFLEKFRKIQRDAVIEYNDLINGSNLVDKKDKFQVLYFEQTFYLTHLLNHSFCTFLVFVF